MKLLSIIVLCTALASCAISPANHEGADAPARAAIVPLKAARPVIGLVLGAGGARGFAHVGVLKALADAGIEADLVVGASSGALVASLYAGGYSAEQLHTLALALEDSDIFDFTFFGPGRVEGAKIARYVNHSLDNRPIEKLNKPFVAVATEQGSNTMAAFNRGNTGLAVRASASVPSVFWPVIIHGRAYVDGGVSSRVPAALAREMGADVVIAVDIASRMSNGDENAADVVIRPKVIRTRINDFKHRQSNIAAGEEAGRAAIAEIRTHMRAVAARK